MNYIINGGIVMKGINYLQMIKDAKTRDEIYKIIITVEDTISMVEAPINNEYSNWTDEELNEYLDNLYAASRYFDENYITMSA